MSPPAPTPENLVTLGYPPGRVNDLIFCQADGRPWNPDHVSKRFKKLAAQAGVPAGAVA